MTEAFDPYHRWLGIPPREQPANHYRLLGIELFERDTDVIAHAADRQMIHVRSFQTGRRAELSQRILNEVSAARLCLLDPRKRAEYDAQLAEQQLGKLTSDGTFGEYALLDHLSSSRSGQLYKGRHRILNRLAAIKLLSEKACKSLDSAARFQRQLLVLSQLKNPHWMLVYDAGIRDDIRYLIMEFVAGWNVGERVRTEGGRPLAESLAVVCQAASGLGYLHHRGLIHRCVSARNLLVDSQFHVRLLGAGLSRVFDPALWPELPHEEAIDGELIIGDPNTIAPEQTRGRTDELGPATDIYGLGCTLFMVATGRRPYPYATAREKLQGHLQEPFPRLREYCPQADAELEHVLEKMVAKRPEDRFDSMYAAIRALQACALQGRYDSASAAHPAPEPAHPAPAHPEPAPPRPMPAPVSGGVVPPAAQPPLPDQPPWSPPAPAPQAFQAHQPPQPEQAGSAAVPPASPPQPAATTAPVTRAPEQTDSLEGLFDQISRQERQNPRWKRRQ